MVEGIGDVVAQTNTQLALEPPHNVAQTLVSAPLLVSLLYAPKDLAARQASQALAYAGTCSDRFNRGSAFIAFPVFF